MALRRRMKIILLGSSMTERSFSLEHQGWGAALANWYARSADVLNRGAGGYNSRWVKHYLETLVGNERPDMTVLFIGNNDAIQEGEQQHVPLAEFKSNVLNILEFLHTINPSMAVLLFSTTRVSESLRPLQRNIQRGRYAEVLRFIYRNRSRPDLLGCEPIPQQMAYVDLWGGEHCSDIERAAQLDRYSIREDDLHDGAHLNAAGNKKLFAAVKNAISFEFPHLCPDYGRPKSLRTKHSGSIDHQLQASAAGHTASPAVSSQLVKRHSGTSLASVAGVGGKRSAAQMEEEQGGRVGDVPGLGGSAGEDKESCVLGWTVPSWRTLV